MTAAIVHTLDPFAIRLWDDVGVRWYGLAYLAGFFVGFLLVRRVLKSGSSPLEPGRASELVATLAIGAVLGGRLGYIAFYRPSLLWTFTDSPPWWEALAINHGGMASHGGMIGVVVAAVIFAHRRRVPFLHVLDLAAFAAPIGLFFGRLANFVNGELYGRPVAAKVPWAVKFPQEILTWSSAQLADLQVRLADAGVAEPLAPSEVIERVQQHDARVIDALAPLLAARHPSQLYEALLEGLFLFVVLALLWRTKKRPGVVAGVFAVCYAAVRIFGEQFRLPDAPLSSLGVVDVTRGQLLSGILFVVGVMVLLASRRPRERLGGWSRPALREQPV